MALSKIQSESINLADTYAFTGTVTGAGGGKVLQFKQFTSSTAISSSTTIPDDNTVPTATEGVQIMTANWLYRSKRRPGGRWSHLGSN